MCCGETRSPLQHWEGLHEKQLNMSFSVLRNLELEAKRIKGLNTVLRVGTTGVVHFSVLRTSLTILKLCCNGVNFLFRDRM